MGLSGPVIDINYVLIGPFFTLDGVSGKADGLLLGTLQLSIYHICLELEIILIPGKKPCHSC